MWYEYLIFIAEFYSVKWLYWNYFSNLVFVDNQFLFWLFVNWFSMSIADTSLSGYVFVSLGEITLGIYGKHFIEKKSWWVRNRQYILESNPDDFINIMRQKQLKKGKGYIGSWFKDVAHRGGIMWLYDLEAGIGSTSVHNQEAECSKCSCSRSFPQGWWMVLPKFRVNLPTFIDQDNLS